MPPHTPNNKERRYHNAPLTKKKGNGVNAVTVDLRPPNGHVGSFCQVKVASKASTKLCVYICVCGGEFTDVTCGGHHLCTPKNSFFLSCHVA